MLLLLQLDTIASSASQLLFPLLPSLAVPDNNQWSSWWSCNPDRYGGSNPNKVWLQAEVSVYQFLTIESDQCIGGTSNEKA